MLMAAGILGGAGMISGYMASREATANANKQAWAQYLNQEHQARLNIQRQNQTLVRGYQKQVKQNLFIGAAATATKINNSQSLRRSQAAQAGIMYHQNSASMDLLESSFSSRNISSTSGTGLALKRQAMKMWQNSNAALAYNNEQQGKKIQNQYDSMLKQRGTDVFIANTYMGGTSPEMQNGTWAAINAGISGGISGAQSGMMLK